MKGRNSNRGHGRGFGNGNGYRSGEGGRGRNSGRGSGPGGYCVCAKCGEKIPHERGVRCTSLKCPSCGNTMVNESLLE